jgi:hypothetical protein
MRRWLAILLLVFLPLQFSWTVAAGYCQHESDASSQHLGHHEHKHQATGGPDSNPAGGVDNDCGTCHAGCVMAIFADLDLPLASSASFVIPWPSGALSSGASAEPERPNWSVLA